jgi:hypothetical protein
LTVPVVIFPVCITSVFSSGGTMGLRYDEVNDHVLALLREVRSQDFPELVNAKIKVLFDLKKRKSGGCSSLRA